MIINALKKLVKKENLSDIEITSIMSEIMEGGLTDAQVSSFLTALRMKGETIEEITACVKLLQEKANKLHLDKNVIDIVGTGGDGASTFNISTATTFVVAAGDVPVAKHGNRAASSKSGSTDVLEALGCCIALNPNENKGGLPVFKRNQNGRNSGAAMRHCPPGFPCGNDFRKSLNGVASRRQNTGVNRNPHAHPHKRRQNFPAGACIFKRRRNDRPLEFVPRKKMAADSQKIHRGTAAVFPYG